MANMGYCRFSNTKQDVDDCIEALENRDIKSSEERHKAKQMLITVLEFCRLECIIEDYEEDIIDEIINETI